MQITKQTFYKIHLPKTRETFIYSEGQEVRVKQGRKWFSGFILDIRIKSKGRCNDLLVKVETTTGKIIKKINPTDTLQPIFDGKIASQKILEQIQEVNMLEAKIKKLKQSVRCEERKEISSESKRFYRDLRSIRSEVVKLNKK